VSGRVAVCAWDFKLDKEFPARHIQLTRDNDIPSELAALAPCLEILDDRRGPLTKGFALCLLSDPMNEDHADMGNAMAGVTWGTSGRPDANAAVMDGRSGP
jgi:hypothetical protein